MRLTVVQDANQGKITALRIRASRNIEAGYDNVQSLGTPNYRWSAFYSGTPTINTSDERHKPVRERIPDSVLDAWQQVDWRTRYKFDNAIAEKGEDGARWHFGLIAQRVEKVFSENGIDGFSFGLLCYDEWESAPAVLDEDGKTISQEVKAGSRYGIRYGEAQALEAALQRRNYERQQDINRKQAATLMELQSRIEVLERREPA
ncbi:tail fiber domain-containing protein [Leclercia adecarboxylata]